MIMIKKFSKKTFDYLDAVDKAYQGLAVGASSNSDIMKAYVANQGSKLFITAEESNKELFKMVRVYLKTEWTRVKCDSSITKIGYFSLWKPFLGFNANKAIEKLSKEYKEID